MASSGGMWHNAKGGGRVAARAGEGRAKASARADERAFKNAVNPGMKKVAARAISRRG